MASWIVLWAAAATAQDSGPPEAAFPVDLSVLDKVDEELAELALLGGEVAIGSRKKESQSLAASIVSVVGREQIDRQGAQTLQEILRTVVGFGSRRGVYNDWQVSLRGYDTSANFLVMLDGHRLNDPLDGSVPWDFPLANVQRIEIIRGPGSAVYGSNAFVGVINIITFDGSSEGVTARAWLGSNHSDFRPVYQLSQPLAGAGLRGATKLGELRIDGNITFRQDQGDALIIPSDNASLRNQSWSLARCVNDRGETVNDRSGFPILRYEPCLAAGGTWNGRTHFETQTGQGSIRLAWKGLELTSSLIADRRGPGITAPDTTHLFLAYQSQREQFGTLSQATFTHAFSDTHQLRLRGSYDQRSYSDLFGEAPAGFVSDSGVVFPDGLTRSSRYVSRDLMFEVLDDQRFQLGEGFAGQLDVDLGVAFDRRQVDSSAYLTNYVRDFSAPRPMGDASNTLPALYFPGTTDPRPECMGGTICTDGRFANVYSGWAQTRWTPKIPVQGVVGGVTVGLRADHEEAIGPVLSPRAGITLTAADDELEIASPLLRALIPDNFKALYGSAFRSPTFKERFDNLSSTFQGNPDLLAERIQSVEVGIGYRLGDFGALFANYFYSDIRNSVQRLYTGGVVPLAQRGARQVQGVEVEVHGSAGRISDAWFNAAYLSGSDTGIVPGFDAPVTTYLEDQPKLRFNAGLEVHAWRSLYAGLYGSYVGARANVQRTGSERSHTFEIPPSFVLNATVRVKEIMPGFTLQMYGRNVLSQDYRDPLLANHDQDVKLKAGDASSYLLPRERFTAGLELIYR